MKDQDSRIVPAPVASDPRLRPTILDVVCGLDEEVEWHFTMADHGGFVSGYSIVRRLTELNNEVCASTETASGTAARKKRPRNRKVRRQDR